MIKFLDCLNLEDGYYTGKGTKCVISHFSRSSDIALPSPAVRLIKNVVSCLWRKPFKGNRGRASEGEKERTKRKVSLYFTSEQVTNSILGFVQWSTLAVRVSKAISERKRTHTLQQLTKISLLQSHWSNHDGSLTDSESPQSSSSVEAWWQTYQLILWSCRWEEREDMTTDLDGIFTMERQRTSQFGLQLFSAYYCTAFGLGIYLFIFILCTILMSFSFIAHLIIPCIIPAVFCTLAKMLFFVHLLMYCYSNYPSLTAYW